MSTPRPSSRAPRPALGSVLGSPWPLRLVWVLLPILLGPALADALADRSRSVQVVASTLAWCCWTVGVGLVSVLRSATLTGARLVVPLALPTAAWAATQSDRAAWAAVAVAAAALATALLALPGVSDAYVDGSSYGDEQRVALRVPLAVVGVAAVVWAVAAGGIVGGALLVAARQWVLGALVVAVGAVAASVVVRQVHVLSRRWLVFVPAGLVVHDPLALTDAVLFPRHLLERVGPATTDAGERDDAVDTSAGTLGLVLEVRGREPVRIGIRRGRDQVERDGVRAVLVSPTRPGTALELARRTRLPVG